jgi:predicted dehydrogenase
VQYLKDALDAGKLGIPHMASVRVWWSRDVDYYDDWHGTWEQAGGVLANQAIHHVDLLQWLMGPVNRVSAFADYSHYTDIETSLVATLEFESNAIGTIEATTLAQPCDLEGSLAILGDKGYVELGGFAVNEVRRWGDDEVSYGENPPDVYGFGHEKLYEDVIKCLQNGDEFPIPPWEARKALEIVHAIYESVETGRVVELDDDYPNSRLGR